MQLHSASVDRGIQIWIVLLMSDFEAECLIELERLVESDTRKQRDDRFARPVCRHKRDLTVATAGRRYADRYREARWIRSFFESPYDGTDSGSRSRLETL